MPDTQTSSQEAGTSFAVQLQDASTLAERGEYAAALQHVRSVKSIQPQNIYVLAFERQVEQLLELTESGSITEEQRADILESIPGIVERAIEQPNVRPSELASPDRRATQATDQERSAALSWLKNQYFQHAHDYVQKGQFSHALTEIQRVFIIDPDNETARDFEKQIHKLLDLKARAANPAGGPLTSPETAGKKESNFWLIVAGVVFVIVTLLVIYFLNR
jgi:tetratricopeptide (TPR) repeat protein